MSVAGAAVLWRNWLEDHKNFKSWIVSSLGGLHKAVTCGSCFTYWLALLFTIIIAPLVYWTPLTNTSFISFIVNTFLQWMALAWLSVFFRFLYVSIQELVNYQVHTLRDHGHEHK